MTYFFKYSYAFVALVCILSSCSKQKFADLNTNPDALLSVPPEYEFSTALLNINNNSNEHYYDYNHAMYYWTQTFTYTAGTPIKVFLGFGNLNQRWDNFYTMVGNTLADVKELIKKLPKEKQRAYVSLNAIADIPMAYYAWYTSDVNGSLPYSQAFKARYTKPPLLAPEYDTQEVLYDTLDNQLKAAVEVLKTNQSVSQVDLTNADLYYHGNPTYWIKAANSLRLRMAFRLEKINPEKFKAIATEVLKDNIGVISSTDEDWKFISGPSFIGDADPASNDATSGSKNTIDFMTKTKDPRIRIFYSPSPFTQPMFTAAQAQGKIPANLIWQAYQGQFTDPDAAGVTTNAPYSSLITFSFNGRDTSLRLPGPIQSRLFLGISNNGNGHTTYPIITYADICFMRAELAVKNIVGGNAEDWYYKGIDASLSNYDEMAKLSTLSDYSPLSQAEVMAYKAQPGIQFDQNNALEQICLQEYLNYYKNQNEAWALLKRTGLPSSNGKIFSLEVLHNAGILQEMPRRFPIAPPSLTDLNFKNITDALADMGKDPAFGDPSDINGRVWWDKP